MISRLGIGAFSWVHVPKIDFRSAIEDQRRQRDTILSDPSRLTAFLTTTMHPPTITLGYRCSQDALALSEDELKGRGIEVVSCERGGETTYHGPGQLMIYPVFHLPTFGLGVRDYISLLENVTIEVLQGQGVGTCETRTGIPGIFTPRGKIAAIGVHVSRGVVIQGVCLNVSGDLTPFRWFDPCGEKNAAVAQIQDFRSPLPSLEVLGRFWAETFARKALPKR